MENIRLFVIVVALGFAGFLAMSLRLGEQQQVLAGCEGVKSGGARFIKVGGDADQIDHERDCGVILGSTPQASAAGASHVDPDGSISEGSLLDQRRKNGRPTGYADTLGD